MSQTTKRALAQSLKRLMAQKPLSKITIADITEDCGINRMTFYYHFQDIYDLIEWICMEEGSQAIQGRTTYQTWQEGFVALCRATLDNRVFVEGVTHNMPKSLLYKAFRNKRVKVNGKKQDPDYRIHQGDLLELYINDEFFPAQPQKAPPKKRRPPNLHPESARWKAAGPKRWEGRRRRRFFSNPPAPDSR